MVELIYGSNIDCYSNFLPSFGSQTFNFREHANAHITSFKEHKWYHKEIQEWSKLLQDEIE